MFKKALLAATIAATCSTTVAEEIKENIVVTATRTAQSIDQALASVDVITADEIARMNPSDGLDLLSQVAGVDITRSGGRGAQASLYLRGTGSSHTLVLVDGVRQGSATLGEAGLQYLDPSQIERVEIVRGPRSSLYGSDALGGVVQVFTRKTESNFLPVITSGFGSNETRESSFNLGGKVDNTSGSTYLNVGASHYETQGIDNHINDAFGDDDRDASRMTTITALVEQKFNNGIELSLDYFRSTGENEYDQGFWAWQDTAPYSENAVESLNFTYEQGVTSGWNTLLILGQSKDESDALNDKIASEHSFFHTERQQITWQNNIQLNGFLLLTAGAEYYEDTVDSSQEYVISGSPVDSRYNHALFAQLQGDISSGINFIAAFRRDKNEQFGVEPTFNIAFGFDLGEEHRLIVSNGTAFKAPTFNDLYWPESPWSAGNPNLEPETARNIDLELRGDYEDFSWSLSAYKNDIKDLIEWAPTDTEAGPGTGPWMPMNVKDADIVGSELSVQTQIQGWSLNSSLSYAEPRDAELDTLLRRRSRSTLTMQVGRTFGSFDLNIDWKAQSHRFEDVANTERLAGYGILGVNLGYDITSQVKVQINIDNALDKEYQLSGDYHTEGRTALFSVRYAL